MGIATHTRATPVNVGLPTRRWVLTAVMIGSLMAGLDSSVSNAALPIIAQDLHADIASTQWVVLVYLLMTGAMALSAGRLGDMLGHRRIYMAGLAAFVIGSAACAFAPALGWLIAARACQALGAAMLVANSPAILTGAFPDHQRGRVLGLQATAIFVGLAIGPSIGGFLTLAYGWGAIFLINVPVGLAAILLVRQWVPSDAPRTQSHREPFDVAGAAAFTAGVVLLILSVNQWHAWGATSPLFLMCLSLGALSLVAFVWIELHTPAPMLQLKLFANRQFSTPVASATLSFSSAFMMLFVLPFYLIQGRGLSAAQAGLVLTAVPIMMPIFAPLSGMVSDRVGARVPTTLGALVTAAGLFALSRVDLEAPIALVVGILVLVGIGGGLFTSPNMSAALGATSRERRGVASGVLATARSIGQVLGFGLGGAIFTMVVDGSGDALGASATAQAASACLLMAGVLSVLAAGVAVTIQSRPATPHT
jgi:EmrB/QacA subfamily drug resistance transporter